MVELALALALVVVAAAAWIRQDRYGEQRVAGALAMALALVFVTWLSWRGLQPPAPELIPPVNVNRLSEPAVATASHLDPAVRGWLSAHRFASLEALLDVTLVEVFPAPMARLAASGINVVTAPPQQVRAIAQDPRVMPRLLEFVRTTRTWYVSPDALRTIHAVNPEHAESFRVRDVNEMLAAYRRDLSLLLVLAALLYAAWIFVVPGAPVLMCVTAVVLFSIGFAVNRYTADPLAYTMLFDQFVGLGRYGSGLILNSLSAALLGLLGIARIDAPAWQLGRFRRPILGVTVALIALLLVFGQSVGGQKIVLFGILITPIIAALALVSAASHLGVELDEMTLLPEWWWKFQFPAWRAFQPVVAIVALTLGVAAASSDWGSFIPVLAAAFATGVLFMPRQSVFIVVLLVTLYAFFPFLTRPTSVPLLSQSASLVEKEEILRRGPFALGVNPQVALDEYAVATPPMRGAPNLRDYLTRYLIHPSTDSAIQASCLTFGSWMAWLILALYVLLALAMAWGAAGVANEASRLMVLGIAAYWLGLVALVALGSSGKCILVGLPVPFLAYSRVAAVVNALLLALAAHLLNEGSLGTPHPREWPFDVRAGSLATLAAGAVTTFCLMTFFHGADAIAAREGNPLLWDGVRPGRVLYADGTVMAEGADPDGTPDWIMHGREALPPLAGTGAATDPLGRAELKKRWPALAPGALLATFRAVQEAATPAALAARQGPDLVYTGDPGMQRLARRDLRRGVDSLRAAGETITEAAVLLLEIPCARVRAGCWLPELPSASGLESGERWRRFCNPRVPVRDLLYGVRIGIGSVIKPFLAALSREVLHFDARRDAELTHAISYSINSYFGGVGKELGAARLLPLLRHVFALPDVTVAQIAGYETMVAIGEAMFGGQIGPWEVGRGGVALAGDGVAPETLCFFEATRTAGRRKALPPPRRIHMFGPESAAVVRRGMLGAALLPGATGYDAYHALLVRNNRCVLVALKTGSHSSHTNTTLVLIDPRWQRLPTSVEDAASRFRPRYVLVVWARGPRSSEGRMKYAGTSVVPIALAFVRDLIPQVQNLRVGARLPR